MIQYGPVYVNDITQDFNTLQTLFQRDYSKIMVPGASCPHPLAGLDKVKTLLDPQASALKLLLLV